MGKILNFPSHRSDSVEITKLKRVSDSIDTILIEALEEQGLEPYELAGLLAHRLGSFIRPINSKERLWGICEEVVKKQAVID